MDVSSSIHSACPLADAKSTTSPSDDSANSRSSSKALCGLPAADLEGGASYHNLLPEMLRHQGFPPAYPFQEHHFGRHDETDDGDFYSQPRIGVQHIDEAAVHALQTFYERTISPAAAVLDL